MPVVQKVMPSRGKNFWESLDLNDTRQMLEVIKEEVNIEEVHAYYTHTCL